MKLDKLKCNQCGLKSKMWGALIEDKAICAECMKKIILDCKQHSLTTVPNVFFPGKSKNNFNTVYKVCEKCSNELKDVAVDAYQKHIK